MERGSAVGATGVKLETAEGDDDFINEEDHKIYRSVCGRLQFASPRRPDLLFTLKEFGTGLAKSKKSHWQLKHLTRYLRGRSETVLVQVPETAMKEILRAQADSDWAGCQSTRRSISCGMIWWGGVLISSYSRTQSTIATSSAESDYNGACACASEAVYVKELLKFLGEEVQIQLELDASSAISMGSRVGLGKATIKLVKVKGTQHPPDVGTKYLSKHGMIHAKTMLGLMEPESLVALGYEIQDSSGIKDQLDRSSSMVASIGIASLMSGRELDRCAASFIFVLAAKTAPLRAAATAATQELVITTSTSYTYSDGDVAGVIKSTLLDQIHAITQDAECVDELDATLRVRVSPMRSGEDEINLLAETLVSYKSGVQLSLEIALNT
eukprot:4749684-Amphidinium_carterae.1